MRPPTSSRSHAVRLAIALLCLACTGAFAAVRGTARVDSIRGSGWMAATHDQLIAPARTAQLLGIVREGPRVDARAEGRRIGLGGPPHSAAYFLVALAAVAPHAETSLGDARRPPSRNRAPYYATAPPALS